MTFTISGKQYFDDGVKMPSVTTILKQWPKNLTKWAAETTAGWMVDHWADLEQLPPSKRMLEGAKAVWAARDAAAMRGTKIHKLGELLVAGESVDVPDGQLGPVEAYARFLEVFGVAPVLVERPVLNRTCRYAGRPDLLAVLGRLGGESWLLDIKTGKVGFEDQALQLAGYGFCEVYLDERKVEQEWPRPERYGVVHVGADFARLIPVDVDDVTFRIFRYVQQCWLWEQQARQAFTEGGTWPFGEAVPEPRPLEVVR